MNASEAMIKTIRDKMKTDQAFYKNRCHNFSVHTSNLSQDHVMHYSALCQELLQMQMKREPLEVIVLYRIVS